MSLSNKKTPTDEDINCESQSQLIYPQRNSCSWGSRIVVEEGQKYSENWRNRKFPLRLCFSELSKLSLVLHSYPIRKRWCSNFICIPSLSRTEEEVPMSRKAKTYKAQETHGRITWFISFLPTNKNNTTANILPFAGARLVLFSQKPLIACSSSLRGGTLGDFLNTHWCSSWYCYC